MSETNAMPGPELMDAAQGGMELVRKAALEGAADAREAADRAWTATNLFVCRFVYTTCYTISYGVVFPSVMLSRSIPKDNIAVRGLIEGAAAAVRKVEDLKSQPSVIPMPAAV